MWIYMIIAIIALIIIYAFDLYNSFVGLFGYKSKVLFETCSNERENVKVEL